MRTGGGLPLGVHALFANTGKECPETLDFVAACAARWSVPIRWIEYELVRGGEKLGHSFREVSYETASRGGEPFDALIEARSFLPNPVMRFCTQELKIRPMKKFAMVALGFDYWTSVIGMRADEPRRVAKATAPAPERWENVCPLAEAGVTEADVLAFWAAQPFDLQLESYEGNCDCCFLKGKDKLMRIMRKRPDRPQWWIGKEDGGPGADRRFRHDRPSYAQMLDLVQRTPLLPFFGDEDALPCACTD